MLETIRELLRFTIYFFGLLLVSRLKLSLPKLDSFELATSWSQFPNLANEK